MKVRFIVDRVVVGGFDMPQAETEVFLTELRGSLSENVRTLAAGDCPLSRNVARERTTRLAAGDARALATSVGAAVVRQAWRGEGRQP